MDAFDIKWLNDNYTDGVDICIAWLLHFEKIGYHTHEQLLEGCKVLRSIEIEKNSIFPHLKVLYEMGKCGFDVMNAAETVKEILGKQLQQKEIVDFYNKYFGTSCTDLPPEVCDCIEKLSSYKIWVFKKRVVALRNMCIEKIINIFKK